LRRQLFFFLGDDSFFLLREIQLVSFFFFWVVAVSLSRIEVFFDCGIFLLVLAVPFFSSVRELQYSFFCATSFPDSLLAFFFYGGFRRSGHLFPFPRSTLFAPSLPSGVCGFHPSFFAGSAMPSHAFREVEGFLTRDSFSRIGSSIPPPGMLVCANLALPPQGIAEFVLFGGSPPLSWRAPSFL